MTPTIIGTNVQGRPIPVNTPIVVVFNEKGNRTSAQRGIAIRSGIVPFSEFIYCRTNWRHRAHMYAGIPCYDLKKVYWELPRTSRIPRPAPNERFRRFGNSSRLTHPHYQFVTHHHPRRRETSTGTQLMS